MPVGDRKDPYRNYNFRLEIDGITRAGFQECSGLDSSQDPIEYREGTDPLTARKLFGLVTYSNITLRWGISDDAELWEWRQQIASGNAERKNGSIVLMDDTGDEKVRWNFREGWPTRWTGPDLSASGNEVAVETLEIAHEGLVKA
jgi:phage tail-like protein